MLTTLTKGLGFTLNCWGCAEGPWDSGLQLASGDPQPLSPGFQAAGGVAEIAVHPLSLCVCHPLG